MFYIVVIREMQNENYCEISSFTRQMAKISKTNDSLYWQGCRIRETLIHCWWKYKLAQPLWKSIRWFSKKVGSQSILRLSCTSLGHIPKRHSILPKGHLLNYVHKGSIHNTQKWETTWICPSIEKQIKKMWHSYTWSATQLLEKLTSWNLQPHGWN